MGNKMGYLVDLAGLSFNESGSSWIQAMPLGKWNHPQHGPIEFTLERIKRFADNFKNNVRGQKLNIDYDHQTGIAAGWVEDVEARTDGLWLLVEWTKDAYTKIKNKEYRYFSPEFMDEWDNPVDSKKYSDVLFGGGITNRPFLKGILPINLSEMFAEIEHESVNMLTDEQMVQLRAKFNLASDSTEEDIMKALVDSVVNAGAPDGQEEAPASGDAVEASATAAPAAPALASAGVGLSEDQVKKLSENPETKMLMEMVVSTNKKLREMENEKKVVKLSDAFAAKGYALPPVVKTAIGSVFQLSEDDKVNDAVMAAFSKIAETGVIQLGEGPSGRTSEEAVDNYKKLNEAAKKLSEDNKISMADAMIEAVRLHPELYNSYRESGE